MALCDPATMGRAHPPMVIRHPSGTGFATGLSPLGGPTPVHSPGLVPALLRRLGPVPVSLRLLG